ncbi:hypothetical protein DYB36_000570 [Aphanomyces astaci]|uniref:tryptophan--tRNA ligase n=2 Tax=Aphanomyces astaci TaxID=112090 RepID=A0A397ANL3_APHAT|nr:hypothetical protein DYB36_000570 [Aphanomyces astaci]RHZ33607.1 hypothetical protein DYB31_012382 [Aphanomyces astaci]
MLPHPSSMHTLPPLAEDGDLLAFMDDTIFAAASKAHTPCNLSSSTPCLLSPRSNHTTDHDTSDDGMMSVPPLEKCERRKQQIRDASRRCRIKQRTEVMTLRARVAELEARVAAGEKLQRDHEMRQRQVELLEREIAGLRVELYKTKAAAKVVFSGIQPTGVPHLGNYCGAVSKWVTLQQQQAMDVSLYSIVDLHAITLPYDPSTLQANIHGLLASLLGCGLDPKKSILFKQSDIVQHSELAWLLSCVTPLSWMQRMTQFKQKSQQKDSNAVSLGVADDPNDALVRIMSLRDPTQKMSKSDISTQSRIDLTDSPDVIVKKIRKAQTDAIPGISYDKAGRPGVSNLMSILSAVTGHSVDDIQGQYGVHIAYVYPHRNH